MLIELFWGEGEDGMFLCPCKELIVRKSGEGATLHAALNEVRPMVAPISSGKPASVRRVLFPTLANFTLFIGSLIFAVKQTIVSGSL